MDEDGAASVARRPYLTWTRTRSFSVTVLVLSVCLCCVFTQGSSSFSPCVCVCVCVCVCGGPNLIQLDTQARWYKVLLVPVGWFSFYFVSPLILWPDGDVTSVKTNKKKGHLWSYWTRLFRIISGGCFLKDNRNKLMMFKHLDGSQEQHHEHRQTCYSTTTSLWNSHQHNASLTAVQRVDCLITLFLLH